MKTFAALVPVLLLAAQGADRLAPLPDWLVPRFEARAEQYPPCVDCNVILVSIDTLRPDRLGCYGHDRPTSPRIDAFCEESVVFEQALANAPSTLPSHASIFTSWIVSHHGAKTSTRTPLADDPLTMAELLTASGWTSVAYTDGGQMSPRWNIDQGFERYESRRDALFHQRVGEAIEWLTLARPERFFLFLHTYEVHHPYTPQPRSVRLVTGDPRSLPTGGISIDLLGRINNGEERLTPALLDEILLSYDAEIRSMDSGFGRLVDWLRETDLLDRTIVILTSDHGEEFDEHGKVGWHSHTLYDELLRVPLAIRLPDASLGGRRVRSVARGIDLFPTLIDLLDLADPGTLEGTSLVPSMFDPGAGPADELVAERDRWQDGHPKALRTARWKLFDGRLFDLWNDPREQHDLAVLYPGVTAALGQRLASLIDARPPPPAQSIELDPELRDQLRALGYIQ